MTLSNPIHLPKAPPLNTIPLRRGLQKQSLGDTDMQSLTLLSPWHPGLQLPKLLSVPCTHHAPTMHPPRTHHTPTTYPPRTHHAPTTHPPRTHHTWALRCLLFPLPQTLCPASHPGSLETDALSSRGLLDQVRCPLELSHCPRAISLCCCSLGLSC